MSNNPREVEFEPYQTVKSCKGLVIKSKPFT